MSPSLMVWFHLILLVPLVRPVRNGLEPPALRRTGFGPVILSTAAWALPREGLRMGRPEGSSGDRSCCRRRRSSIPVPRRCATASGGRPLRQADGEDREPHHQYSPV